MIFVLSLIFSNLNMITFLFLIFCLVLYFLFCMIFSELLRNMNFPIINFKNIKVSSNISLSSFFVFFFSFPFGGIITLVIQGLILFHKFVILCFCNFLSIYIYFQVISIDLCLSLHIHFFSVLSLLIKPSKASSFPLLFYLSLHFHVIIPYSFKIIFIFTVCFLLKVTLHYRIYLTSPPHSSKKTVMTICVSIL